MRCIVAGAFSFLIAYILVSVVRLLWNFDTIPKVIMFFAGVFFAANIVNFKLSDILSRVLPEEGPSVWMTGVLGGAVILVLSVSTGIIKLFSIT